MSRLFDISSQPGEFLSRYSSVLKHIVSDNEVVRDLAAATAFNIAQLMDSADEIKQSIGVHELVDRRRVYVVPIRIRESELAADINVFTYGSGAVFGDGNVYGRLNTQAVSFGVPAGIASIGMLVDSFIADTVAYLPGSDFVLRGTVLTLWQNPFDVLSSTSVYDGTGAVVDREIVLWGIDVAIWDRLAESMYGLIAGIADRGELGYAAVVGALWDALLQGPSIAAMYAVFTAAAGIETATAAEPVVAVTSTPSAVLVTTATKIYRGHASAVALVSVGDVLVVGEPVFDTVVIRDLARTDSDLTGIPALTFPVQTPVGPGVVGFSNHLVPVHNAPGGVTFEVAGSHDSVAAFWTAVRSREVADSMLLGDMLKAEFGAVPLTLNPLKYLVSHLFLANAVVVTVRPQAFFNDPALLTRAGQVFAKLMPSRVLLIQHSYLDAAFDSLRADTGYPGVGFIDAMAQRDGGKATGVADPATELAYSDLQPMLAHYVR